MLENVQNSVIVIGIAFLCICPVRPSWLIWAKPVGSASNRYIYIYIGLVFISPPPLSLLSYHLFILFLGEFEGGEGGDGGEDQ